MDSLQRATVALLIVGDDLIPAEVSAMLGGSPQFAVAKGEQFLAKHGKKVEAKTGNWQFGGGWESPSYLDRQINELLSALTNDMSRWREVTNRYHSYLSVGGYFNDWTGGMTLSPDTLRLLADRNLPIDFDLYAPAASN